MRILSLSPSFTDILLAFGLHENLAGITDECSSGLGNPVRVGPPGLLSLGAIDALSPDLILTERKENRPEVIKRLEQKYRVVSFDVVTVASVISAISETGKLTDCEEQAKQLVREIYQEWPAPDRDPVRTAILVWSHPVTTVSSRSYVSQLVEAAGGWNLYREDPLPEVPIELEEMLDMNPDLLVLPSAPYAFDQKSADYFQKLPAFSQRKVALVDGMLFTRFGPATVKALKQLKQVIQSCRSSDAR